MKFRRKRPSEKWPRGPRFTIGSVTGVLISPLSTGGGQQSRALPTLWYVHDAAYGYRIVASTRWDTQEARSIARRLNKEHAQ